MKRREFITLLGGAAALWPRQARPQADRLRRVGIMIGTPEDDKQGQAWVNVVRSTLRSLGWTDQNLQMDIRYSSGDVSKAQAIARELVALHPDIIILYSTPNSLALHQETSTTPIVFVSVSDPVGSGLVSNLKRPDGNITGFANFEFSMGGKWVELLGDIVPQVRKAAIVFNPNTAPYYRSFLQSIERAGLAFSIEPIAVPVHDELQSAEGIAKQPPLLGSLIVLPDIFTTSHRKLIISLTQGRQLPAIYPFRYFALDGGSISYGSDGADLYRRAAGYTDRILRGDKVADLPVQHPTKFELAIKLKTANALGLIVPPTLLARADEVIE